MGAISKRTLPQIIDWGPDLIVLGGAIFESEKIKLNLKEISEILHSIGH
jgi:pentose-5-phosphate-3-epimerase